jgi:hypothetical protein
VHFPLPFSQLCIFVHPLARIFFLVGLFNLSKLSIFVCAVLSIRVLQARNAHAQRFPTVETLETWGGSGGDNNGGQEDSLQLSARALLDHAENGAVRLVFVAYNEFDAILVPPQTPPPSRRYYSDSGSPGGVLRFINSKVIGASLGKGRHVRLADPVQITLKHLRSGTGPVCVYWDYTTLAWSNAGCRLISTNATHSRCECNHLTNFALLMEEGDGAGGIFPPLLADDGDVTTVALAGGNNTAGGGISSHITTIIACVATLVCLTLMLFAFVLTWRKFRVSHQCRSMLQKSGIPCFHKTKELSEKDKKAGNFYTVTPKLNNTSDGGGTATGGNSGSAGNGNNLEVNNIELDNEQYFQHMLSMQKNQETSILGGLSKTMSRRNTVRSSLNAATAAEMADQQQETSLGGADVVDLAKTSLVAEHNLNNQQQRQQQQLTLNSSTRTRNNNNNNNNSATLRSTKAQCQHHPALQQQQQLPHGGLPTDQLVYPKKNNHHHMGRAMSPFNHIYMEIDPKTTSSASASSSSAEEAALYEALNQSETYNILSSVSDLSDDEFRRRCFNGGGGGSSDVGSSRQSSARCYAENKPLLFRAASGGKLLEQQQQQHRSSNLLNTISGVLQQQQQSQSLRLAPQHHRTSILSTISGLRYTTNEQGRPTVLNLPPPPPLPGGQDELGQQAPPLQVTTVNGNQFVCLNLNNESDAGHNTSTYVTASDLNQCYASLSDTYITAAAGNELRGLNTASFAAPPLLSHQHQQSIAIDQQPQLFQPGMVQTPVHSKVVIQRIGTLPRQFAHPLAHH